MIFKHPAKVCMTYTQHMKFSLGLSKDFLEASAKAVVHAFLPDCYITSSSDYVEKINKKLNSSGCKSPHRDLNSRPLHYKCNALPTELYGRKDIFS